MWTLDSDAGPPHWRPSTPVPGARLAFSTRRGGVSPAPFETLNLGRSTADEPGNIATNRSRFLARLGVVPGRLVTAGQVHGARVVEASEPGHQAECDALLTTVPGLALAVTTADCMSLLFTAPRAVAAAHAGWRGTASGMPEATLAALCERAACDPAGVTVHVGPCIRGCCYEVGDEVARLFPPDARRRVGDRERLDLPTAARLALRAAGVPDDAIHDTGACTACEPHWYFSHRRDAGRTGRLWGVAVLDDGRGSLPGEHTSDEV
jgi:YfiH family protein